jgi:polar amino acid transport system substrate-binding protein
MQLRASLICLLVLFSTSLLAGDPSGSTLRVGTSAGYPPLTFKQDGTFTGMEMELAQAVGQQLHRRVTVVELPFDQLIAALNADKIDVIMSGLSITDERSRQVLFTEPYLQIGQMGLIRSDDLLLWSQPQTLFTKGRKVGVKRGTTGEQFAREQLPGAAITAFESIDAATDALVAGKIDIFIHDAPTVWRLTASTATQQAGLMGLYRPLTEEYLAWAVRQQDKELASKLNQALDALRQNGTLKRLEGKWIPVQVTVGR